MSCGIRPRSTGEVDTAPAHAFDELVLVDLGEHILFVLSVKSSASVGTLAARFVAPRPLSLGFNLGNLEVTMDGLDVWLEDEATEEELNRKLSAEGSAGAFLRELACLGQEHGKRLSDQIRVAALGVVVIAETECPDLTVTGPADFRVGEEGRAHGRNGNGKGGKTRAIGQDFAEVLVRGRRAWVRVEEAGVATGRVLKNAERVLGGLDNGHDAINADGVQAGHVELFEARCGACDVVEVLVVDGLEVGVADELELLEPAEVNQIGFEGALVHVVGRFVFLLTLEVDGLKFKVLERLWVINPQDLSPLASVEMADQGPWNAQRGEVRGAIQGSGDLRIGVKHIEAVEPHAADLLGNVRVLVHQLHNLAKRTEGVSVHSCARGLVNEFVRSV